MREELEEFQISSREFECEFEVQFEQLEFKNKDFLLEILKFGSENFLFKVKIWIYFNYFLIFIKS